MKTRCASSACPTKPEEDTLENLTAIIEAILFVSGDPVRVDVLAHAMNLTVQELEQALDELRDHLALENRGIQLNRSGETVFLSICPKYAPQVELFLQPIQKQPLSQAVLETLSIIAYRQPVTKGDIEGVRGVKCDYSVQSLVTKGLIEEVGRKEALGRPILYGTTDAFLRHFCIGSLSELPEIDFSRLAARLEAGTDGQEELLAHEEGIDNGTAVEQ